MTTYSVLFTKYHDGDQNKDSKMKGHVARMGQIKNACKFQSGKLNGRDYFGVLCTDGRIILK
jgi:hypothetical protein